MKWLRKLLGLTKRDKRIEQLGGLVDSLTKTSNDLEERLIQVLDPKTKRFTAPPATIDWTPDNCMALRSFLSNETGRKMIEICGGRAFQEAMKEAQGDRSNPQGAGMDAMIRFQFNLASDAAFQTLSEAPADTEAPLQPDSDGLTAG